MFRQDSVLHVQIGKDISRTGGLAGVKLTDKSQLADGEIVITDVDGTILDTTTVLTRKKVVVVQRSGDNLLKTPTIVKANVLEYDGQAFSATQEQIDYIGFNGTSGEIDVISDNVYLIRIHRIDTQATYGNKEMLKFGVFESDTSATQEEISTGLQKSLIANFQREPEREIKFELVHSDAGAGVGAGNYVFTYKDTKVTAPVGHGIVAGDYIRVGGTTTAFPVYKVTVAAATELTLAVAFQGDSATIAAANIEKILAANVAAGDFGIKLTGLPRKFKVGEFKYSKSRWKIALQRFGATEVTESQLAKEGVGEGEQVAELEWFAQGNEGKIERIGTPSPVSRADAVATSNYSLLYLQDEDKSHKGIQGTPSSLKQVIIAFDKTDGSLGTQATGVATAVADVLDAWLSANEKAEI